jgi:radical SAM protein with 4Fe4S-binding SPASM domain
MVLIKDCIDDMLPLVELGKKLGVDYVVIKQCSTGGKYKNIPNYIVRNIDKYKNIIKKMKSLSNENYEIIIKKEKITKDKIRSYDRCYGCEFLPQISGNGDVYVCGNHFGNKRFLLGNIIDQSFKDIVYSKNYDKIMTNLKENVDVNKICNYKCRHNEINEFLWKLKNPPNHINFI